MWDILVGDSHIEDDFVQKLECVTQEHQRHDAEVDAPAQGLQINGIDGCSISMVVEILPSGVDLARGVVVHLCLSRGDVDAALEVGPVGAVLI